MLSDSNSANLKSSLSQSHKRWADAKRWWKCGAENRIRIKTEQGDAESQNNLGAMYANGEGIVQDDKQAACWFRKAADQGEAVAQFNLGWM